MADNQKLTIDEKKKIVCEKESLREGGKTKTQLRGNKDNTLFCFLN